MPEWPEPIRQHGREAVLCAEVSQSYNEGPGEPERESGELSSIAQRFFAIHLFSAHLFAVYLFPVHQGNRCQADAKAKDQARPLGLLEKKSKRRKRSRPKRPLRPG